MPKMPAPPAPETVWPRRILLAGTFLGMAASYRLWLTSRRFPLVPIADWFPSPAPPLDAILFALLLALVVAAMWYPRGTIPIFLLGAIFLVLADQTRLQPWFYQYVVMIGLLLFPERVALAGCRVALSGVYVWSGIQKLNAAFFNEVVPWFAEPVAKHLPEGAGEALQFAIAASPVLEILIGLAVWSSPLRRFAIAAAFLLHAGVLLVLGPLGHDYNLVVWPWNLTMPLLLAALFPRGSVGRVWATLWRSKPAFVLVLLFALLPVLSFAGRWDSYMSFAVYSGNTARLDLFVSPALARRLPEWLRRFVVPTVVGRPIVDIVAWGVSELGVPPLGEPRSFRAVARFVARYAESPEDIQLVIAPRAGRTETYDGAALNPSLQR